MGSECRSLFRVLAACSLMLPLLAGCASPSRTAEDGFAATSKPEPTPRTLHMMARLLHEQGKNAKAEYVLTHLIEAEPNHLPSYIELANIQCEQGRLDHAVSTLQDGREVAPADPVLANNLGLLYLQQSRYTLALETFEDAIEADPNEARYTSNRALTLAMLGRTEQAREAYERVVSPAEAQVNIGVALEAVDKYPEAIEAYTKAIELGASLDTDLDVPEPSEIETADADASGGNQRDEPTRAASASSASEDP